MYPGTQKEKLHLELQLKNPLNVDLPATFLAALLRVSWQSWFSGAVCPWADIVLPFMPVGKGKGWATPKVLLNKKAWTLYLCYLYAYPTDSGLPGLWLLCSNIFFLSIFSQYVLCCSVFLKLANWVVFFPQIVDMSQATLIQAWLISNKYLAFLRKLGFLVCSIFEGNCSKNWINDSVMGLWNMYPNLLSSVMIHTHCSSHKRDIFSFTYSSFWFVECFQKVDTKWERFLSYCVAPFIEGSRVPAFSL